MADDGYKFSDPNTVAAISAAVASLIALVTVVFNLRQMRQTEKERRAAICLEISRRYDELYDTLIELDGTWIEWEDFHKQFPNQSDKLASDEWKLLRKAGGFFELVGAFVNEELVDSELLFKFMNIRPRIWLHYREVVLKMREIYFPELWHQWEALVNTYYASSAGRSLQRVRDEEAVRDEHSRATSAAEPYSEGQDATSATAPSSIAPVE